MPFYRCKIADSMNVKKTMVIEAQDEVVLQADLKRDGLFLMKYSVIREKKRSVFFSVRSRVKNVEIVSFLREFAVMVKAAIPINTCINTLRNQKYSPALKKVLQEVYFDIEAGVLLSEAFAKHRKVFPTFFVNMVAIGESSGSLDKVLVSMADYYENDRKIKRKVKSSMIYPIILLCLTFVITLFINLFVLPTFEGIIAKFDGELPQITKGIMAISKFMQNYFFIILPALAVLIFLIVLFFKTKSGRYVKDYLLFHLPIIRKVEKNLITARFAKAFIILLSSGMNMVDCLENLKRMLGNQIFSQKFNFTIEEVKRGRRIAESLAATKLFPEMLTEMIKIGEQSGNMEETLLSSGNYFDECVESSISKAISTLEPILIMVLGVIIGVVILAVLVPMISMMQSI